jgi:hypothetical protein
MIAVRAEPGDLAAVHPDGHCADHALTPSPEFRTTQHDRSKFDSTGVEYL